jgi:tetratricopeptide (TPR) repeat protein
MSPKQILQRAISEYQAGRLSKARELASQVLTIKRKNPDALGLLGVIALAEQLSEEAVSLFNRLVKAAPANADGHYHLGLAHMQASSYAKAAAAFEKVVRLRPGHFAAWSELCTAARLVNDLDRAVEAGETAVRLAPEYPGPHNNLAGAYEMAGNKSAVLEHFRKAAELEPDNPTIQKNLGNVYVSMGAVAQAETCFRTALKNRPDDGEAWRLLVRLRKWPDRQAPEFNHLSVLLATPSLAETDRCQIHFALARMYQNCGDYDRAFEQLLTGNGIEHRRSGLRPESVRDEFTRLIDSFDAELIERLSGQGDPDPTPIFIVGMPRSGTSLVEQIIASHPHAFGAGELHWFNAAARGLPATVGSDKPYPQCVDALTPEHLQQLGRSFRSFLDRLSGCSFQRMTDKLPENFFHLGLIALVFPNARILHCRRHPRDNAVSIFSEIFPGIMRYSYDLFTLGAFYQQYQRLMTHWDTVLPGRITHIDYESLVSNPEEGIRSIIAATGLEWDDHCLRFHEHTRRVSTASDLQVRQPMHTRSIGRWKHYADYLKPFEKGLAWESQAGLAQ